MSIDVSKIRALDCETPKMTQGRCAPPIVVGSMAEVNAAGEVVGRLLPYDRDVYATAAEYLKQELLIVGANIAFDMTCLAAMNPAILWAIFAAYRNKKIIDVSIVQTLDSIYGGHLGIDPRSGMPLRNPSTGKVSNRYALATVLDLILGRTDAKDAAAWRMSYELLRRVPRELWPPDASEYPVHDTKNTLLAFLGQIRGWVRGRVEPNESGPARNFDNAFAQCETAFCLALGACWSLRTDGAKVEALAAKVEKQHEDAIKRFQRWGWRRADGTEDQVAVKKAVARAYGVTGICPRCGGSGVVRPVKMEPCRGVKLRGRFQGCVGVTGEGACSVCSGLGEVPKVGAEVTCLGREGGCDGTGFDLKSQPLLPRSDKGGIRADRDTLMESGDDELAVYGEDEFEKVLTTFIPYLRTGVVGPLKLTPNVLVASGRLSYEGSPFHQIPRSGGVRECIVARPRYVLGSTDYSAGELCSLSQFCKWVIGYSAMLDAINASGDPGILHSEGAAAVIGISIKDFLVRLKAKEKQCVDFRQAFKPISFGSPAGMGAPKIVWTSRKRNAGFTLSEYGPSVDDDGNRGYAGIRFCILVGGAKKCGVEKITQWKKRETFPVCKACVDVVENVLRVAYFKRFPEIRQYFTWVSSCIKAYGHMPCLVWDAEAGKTAILRWRAVSESDFPSACNNGFQALLADIMKRAYVAMTREGYLGVKDDGSPSPLAGCRFPVVMHDEPVSELFEETAHISGPRIGEIMVQAGKDFAPDVTWVAQTAISRYLSKSMDPVHDSNGKLILWEPKKKKAAA